MKTISAALKAHMSLETTTLAYLIRIERADGTIMGFTTHDEDIVYSGTTYSSENSFTSSSVESHNDLSVDNLSALGILSSNAISETDLAAGKYDNALVDVYLCNWNDLTMGVLQIRHGWLGSVTTSKGSYSAEVVGMHDKLQKTVGHYYIASCRHSFGDSICGLDINTLYPPVSGRIDTVTSNLVFSDNSTSSLYNAAVGYYNYGIITWLTGNNSGLTMEIKDFHPYSGAWYSDFTLWLPMPYAFTVGDTFSVQKGCDKRFDTCKNTFSNTINFGGFPHIPGIDTLLLYPKT